MRIIVLLVPTVAIAVGNNMYTLNPSDFAFGDAGNGMTFGGVGLSLISSSMSSFFFG